jgi:hypothetical protein
VVAIATLLTAVPFVERSSTFLAMNNDLPGFGQFTYIQSRIPALDALVTFIPDHQKPNPAVDETIRRIGYSRWYEETGGHRVLVLYEGGPYDSDHFCVERGVWDHEHCKRCNTRIESMTLCWVTESGPYIILCQDCHAVVTAEGA